MARLPIPAVYVALLFAALALGYASWPIVAADTDLWYHLNAGRHIAATGALPANAFFSFLRPSPAWLDYYWLAQLAFYGVHSAAGYFGLVDLRALLGVATYALILATLRVGVPREEGWLWTALVFTAAALFLVGRLTLLRPGSFSYLMIAAFLFLLESRRALLALPALAVLWMNLHGIEYPVMLLILGAYLGEWALARAGLLANVAVPPLRECAAVAAALLAPLATPYGVGLLAAPFRPLGFASQYIQELEPFDWPSALELRPNGFYLPRPAFVGLLLGASALAALAGLARGRLRPAHLALAAGGAVLLSRADRFSAEQSLLVIPLLAAFRPRLALAPAVARPIALALGVAVAALPFYHLYRVLETSCAFPLCSRGLPQGSVAFLNQVGATGAVLNHPNQGGYLEWELSPRQTIFADLQTPFLFSDRDVFAASQAFRDGAVFDGIVAAYHPAFVLAPVRAREAASWIGAAGYAPVFADDASVLFADARAQPDLVARYGLTAIDPFALAVTGDRAEAAAQLARVLDVDPTGARLRVFAGELALDRGELDVALRAADTALGHQPDDPDALRLRGDVLFRQQKYDAALAAFQAARANPPDDARAALGLDTRLFATYLRLSRPADAYAVIRRALADLYRPEVGYRELAALANAALDAGDTANGRTLVEFALAKTPANEAELRRSLEARLRSAAPGH